MNRFRIVHGVNNKIVNRLRVKTIPDLNPVQADLLNVLHLSGRIREVVLLALPLQGCKEIVFRESCHQQDHKDHHVQTRVASAVYRIACTFHQCGHLNRVGHGVSGYFQPCPAQRKQNPGCPSFRVFKVYKLNMH